MPVYLRNQDFDEGGPASEAERAEKLRIYRDTLRAGLPAGTVCIYLLDPDARPVDTAPLNRPEATDPAALAAKLLGVASKSGLNPSASPIAARPQSARPSAPPGSLVLHLTARYLEKSGSDLVRIDVADALGTRRGGGWASLPAETWVTLDPAAVQRLVPSTPVKLNDSWELPNEVMDDLLHHFYPPTENTDLSKNRIEEQVLSATVESIEGDVARVRLTGRLRMKHPFYHRDDNNHVHCDLLGYMELNRMERQIKSFRLVTENGMYGGDVNGNRPFGVAVRSHDSREP